MACFINPSPRVHGTPRMTDRNMAMQGRARHGRPGFIVMPPEAAPCQIGGALRRNTEVCAWLVRHCSEPVPRSACPASQTDRGTSAKGPSMPSCGACACQSRCRFPFSARDASHEDTLPYCTDARRAYRIKPALAPCPPNRVLPPRAKQRAPAGATAPSARGEYPRGQSPRRRPLPALRRWY